MAFGDFIERWICCGTLDDADVLDDVRLVRRNPDTLAEACVQYTHDPTEHHITYRAKATLNTDNGDEIEDVFCVTPVIRETATMGGPEPKGSSDSPSLIPTCEPAPVEAEELYGPSSVYRVCQDVIEVKQHRRLPHPKRGDYIPSIVSDIKNRMGCPTYTTANELAVRRMANNIMGKHGVRASHTRASIELVIAGVFVPDEFDLRRERVLQSASRGALVSESRDCAPRSAWYDLFHPFKSRGASRVRENV